MLGESFQRPDLAKPLFVFFGGPKFDLTVFEVTLLAEAGLWLDPLSVRTITSGAWFRTFLSLRFAIFRQPLDKFRLP